jgi:hypothetical protein
MASWFNPLSRAMKSGSAPGSLDYLIGRAFFRGGLLHLAFQRFSRAVTSVDPESRSFRIAAAQCLTRIQEENPAFRLARSASEAMIRNWREGPEAYRGALLMAVLRGQVKADQMPKELLASPRDRIWVDLVNSLVAVGDSSDEKNSGALRVALESAGIALKDTRYRPLREMADLTLVRSLNLAGKISESIEA